MARHPLYHLHMDELLYVRRIATDDRRVRARSTLVCNEEFLAGLGTRTRLFSASLKRTVTTGSINDRQKSWKFPRSQAEEGPHHDGYPSQISITLEPKLYQRQTSVPLIFRTSLDLAS